MRAEVIATGTELLTGGVLDTNSLFLSEELLSLGIETAFKTTVGDDEGDMEGAFRAAIARANVVIITGGIGPTEDDITRKVIAKIVKKRLVLNEDAHRAIHQKLAGRNKETLVANDRQALVPAGARLLRNPVGIAPGFYVEEEEAFIAVLPGVPRELYAMFHEELKPVLAERVASRHAVRRRVLHICGLSESGVNQAIQEIMHLTVPVVGLCARETGVDIRIIASGSSAEEAQALADRTEDVVRKKLGDAIYAADGQTMEEVVGALLKQHRLTLAVAESCTGGLIGARITNIAGSSDYFERGAVTYSNNAKTEMLGVPQALIDRHGAVSSEVAGAMAEGVRQSAKTDIGLSVTGIAGPGGRSERKPVGLVYIALATAQGVRTAEHRFLGDREHIRMRSAQMALDMVRRHLIG
jgi:nicotinamide-nucleotide amidase